MKFIGISTEPRRIIGVVPDVDDENIIPQPAMTIYQPSTQEGFHGRLFVRARMIRTRSFPPSRGRSTTCQQTSPWSAPARWKIFARKC